MARVDNLANFLTDVASAIRKKQKTSALIDVSELDDVIENIPNTIKLEKETVKIIDYEGNIAYSYTPSEFLALDSYPTMPEIPDYFSGKVTFGWLESLTDAKAWVRDYGGLEIGYYAQPRYDAAILIRYYPYYTYEFNIKVTGNDENNSSTVTVYWGDGESSSITVAYGVDGVISHTYPYSSSGYSEVRYVIEINGDHPYKVGEGIGATAKASIMYGSTSSQYVNSLILGAFFKQGDNFYPTDYLLAGANNLQYVYFYNNNFGASRYCVSNASALNLLSFYQKFITTTNGLQSSTKHLLFNISNTMTMNANFNSNACKAIYFYTSDQIVPSSSTSSGSLFVNCTKAKKIVVKAPNAIGITANVLGSFLVYDYLLEELILDIPNLTTMGSNMFQYITSLKILNLSSLTQVPDYNNCFGDSSVPSSCIKIIVPDSLYSTWIATTGWSNLSSNIISKSDWDALNN